jgi:hypothetical protein
MLSTIASREMVSASRSTAKRDVAEQVEHYMSIGIAHWQTAISGPQAFHPDCPLYE